MQAMKRVTRVEHKMLPKLTPNLALAVNMLAHPPRKLKKKLLLPSKFSHGAATSLLKMRVSGAYPTGWWPGAGNGATVFEVLALPGGDIDRTGRVR